MDEKRIERIEKKVDSIDEKQGTTNEELARINVTLQHNNENWLQHMARTAANEEAVEIQRQSLEEMKNTFTKHLGFVKGATWVAGTMWVVSIALITILLRIYL